MQGQTVFNDDGFPKCPWAYSTNILHRIVMVLTVLPEGTECHRPLHAVISPHSLNPLILWAADVEIHSITHRETFFNCQTTWPQSPRQKGEPLLSVACDAPLSHCQLTSFLEFHFGVSEHFVTFPLICCPCPKLFEAFYWHMIQKQKSMKLMRYNIKCTVFILFSVEFNVQKD